METKLDVDIGWMIRRDMHDVMDIEQLSFEFPWTEEEYIECLKQRDCIGMIARVDGSAAGTVVYRLLPKKLHVLSLAVHPDWRRQGVGTAIIDRLVAKISQQRRNEIMMEVRETNLNAQLFLRANGFLAGRVLREFYEQTNEDAYQFFRMAE